MSHAKLFILAFLLSSNSYPQTDQASRHTGFNEIEFDENLEKGCFQEFKKIGCINRLGEESTTCVKRKRKKLPKKCQDFLDLRDSL